jgi:hypothetical protein
MSPVSFGFLEDACTITWDGSASSIAPLPSHSELVAGMKQDPCVLDGWCYPPLRPVKAGTSAPLAPVRFSLPATHQLQLTAAAASDEEANFMIAMFGMLKGQRLQRPEWQHFYKAPVARKLIDFVAGNSQIEQTMDIATAFWRQHTSSEVRRLAFGALHWHLFAQLYEHQFERFNSQYMALDACSELALVMKLPDYPAKRPPHATRASVLCSCTGVPKPAWVDPVNEQRECAVAQRRNELSHEAMYGGQPVGFAHPVEHTNMELELTGLVARIFLRLLGVSNEYTRSECTTRQTMGFSF